ncbi:MAG: hypothetical protein FWD87_05125 [Spirochaetaceae bacterium]|nr:hypothetical protein [Spirochaetaceae bacterium]
MSNKQAIIKEKKTAINKEHEIRQKWSKDNDYEVTEYCFCVSCRHFKIDINYPFHGDCSLMAKEGGYSGVVVEAICNRYLSSTGMDINGKQVNPAILAKDFKVVKLGNGVYLPRDTIYVNKIELA